MIHETKKNETLMSAYSGEGTPQDLFMPAGFWIQVLLLINLISTIKSTYSHCDSCLLYHSLSVQKNCGISFHRGLTSVLATVLVMIHCGYIISTIATVVGILIVVYESVLTESDH